MIYDLRAQPRARSCRVTRRGRWLCAAVLMFLFDLGPALAAQSPSYPTKPIRVIVGFAPGGSADITARTVGQKMAELLGQPVVVDNRSGASGIIGSELTARAAPDGYTLLEATMTTHGIGPSPYQKLPLHPPNNL